MHSDRSGLSLSRSYTVHVRAVLRRRALHPGDAARGDRAPERKGLAATAWYGVARRAMSYEGLEDGAADAPVASPPSLCNQLPLQHPARLLYRLDRAPLRHAQP